MLRPILFALQISSSLSACAFVLPFRIGTLFTDYGFSLTADTLKLFCKPLTWSTLGVGDYLSFTGKNTVLILMFLLWMCCTLGYSFVTHTESVLTLLLCVALHSQP